MPPTAFHKNAALLAQLLKNLIAERFKIMAREELLSKYLATPVDPVLLVDLNLQVERDAIQLTEMSLLELVTADRMVAELKRTSKRIQKSFQTVFGEDSSVDFVSDSLVQKRMMTIRSRIDFYNPFLISQTPAQDIISLTRGAFQERERFEKRLQKVLDADAEYLGGLVKETAEIHRFLVRKSSDLEVKLIRKSWEEFAAEVFKKPAELS